MSRFLDRLNTALNETHNRITSIPRSIPCEICGQNHLVHTLEIDGIEVAQVKRRCNTNTGAALGWQLVYTSNIYRDMEAQHDQLDAGTASEQGQAPFRTAEDAMNAAAGVLGVPLAKSAIQKKEVLKGLKPASQLSHAEQHPNDLMHSGIHAEKRRAESDRRAQADENQRMKNAARKLY